MDIAAHLQEAIVLKNIVKEMLAKTTGDWDFVANSLTTTGTGTFGDLVVDTNTLVVDKTNDRVGIGTASPGETLEVAGNIAVTGVAGDDVYIYRNAGTGIRIRSDSLTTQWWAGDDGPAYFGTVSNDDFHIQTNNNNRITIKSGAGSGNVGIGTATPESLLDVRGGTGGILTLATSDTTVGDGDILGQINFQAPLEASGTDAILVGASIWGEADGNFLDDANPTVLVFATAASGTATERMRLSSIGWLGIGTPTPNNYLDIELPATGNQLDLGLVITRDTGSITIGQSTGHNTDFFPSIMGKPKGDRPGLRMRGRIANVANPTYEAFGLQAANYANNGPMADDEIAISFNNWATNLMVVKGDGKVGIGTVLPDGKLHVHQGSAGVVTAHGAADDLVIENNTSAGMSILTPDGSESDIFFGSASDSVGARLSWSYSNNYLRVSTAKTNAYIAFQTGNQVTKMTLLADGKLGIGTTTPATSAKVDITSTTGALIVPRMTTTQRNALTAVNGMIIYNTTTTAFNFYENGAWVAKADV